MTDPSTPAPAGAWSPYPPDAKAPWDLRRVSHLHRRAGFAATWAELRRDLKDGPKASIDRLLAGREYAAAEGSGRANAALADAAVARNDLAGLRAWWVHRMLTGP